MTPEQQARVDALLNESDSLRNFLLQSTKRADADVTTAELIEGYFRFCSDREWTPAKTVERKLKDLMLQIYGVNQSHNISRGGSQLRGWAGVSLTSSESSPQPFAYANND